MDLLWRLPTCKKVAWTSNTKVKVGTKPLVMARALKLYAWSKSGGGVLMLCYIKRLTHDTLVDKGHQVLFAMEELIRVGRIYFSTVDTTSQEWEHLRALVETRGHHGNLLRAFITCHRRASLLGWMDILALCNEDDLCLIWVAWPRVDTTHVLASFHHVFILRENIHLEYVFGAVEATGV